MEHKHLLAVVGLALTLTVGAGTLEAQHDPGPRGGDPGVGGSFPDLALMSNRFSARRFRTLWKWIR